MSIDKLKIFWFVLFIYLLIFFIRFDLIIGLLNLSVRFVLLLFSGTDEVESQVDLSFLDSIISAVLFLIIPVLLITIKNFRKLLSNKLTPSISVLILLLLAFFYAPIITNQHPEFQKNISVTKLLSPLSHVKYVLLDEEIKYSDTPIDKFIELKNKFIPKSFNDKIIFIDSIANKNLSSDPMADDSLFRYYQADVLQTTPVKILVKSNGKIFIGTKIFWLGSDEFGRDIFTRIIFGTRISILVGGCSIFVTFLVGILFAFIAAQNGKFIDVVINRFSDLFLSLPAIFLVIMMLALFGNNLISVILVLGLSGWMSLFKIVRTEIISIKKKDYFLTAELIGLGKSKLLVREIFPVIIIPVIANLVFQFSNVILAESALSFLGLGTGSSYPSWGAMIESGQEYISQTWWMIFIPGFVLIITLISINSIGNKIVKYYNPKYQI